MFSSARDLATFLAACIDGVAIDPQLRQALQMTQRETFGVSEKFGQAMAWENVHLNYVDIVDKPGVLNNASAYVGLVPAQKPDRPAGNSGNFPHEIARYRVLPELARKNSRERQLSDQVERERDALAARRRTSQGR